MNFSESEVIGSLMGKKPDWKRQVDEIGIRLEHTPQRTEQ
jgi:hypothetical protein